MTPTPKLRFIERSVPAPEYGENIAKKVRILQQWWAMKINDNILPSSNGEWRDVPMEEL